jgi:hypothetical protein
MPVCRKGTNSFIRPQTQALRVCVPKVTALEIHEMKTERRNLQQRSGRPSLQVGICQQQRTCNRATSPVLLLDRPLGVTTRTGQTGGRLTCRPARPESLPESWLISKCKHTATGLGTATHKTVDLQEWKCDYPCFTCEASVLRLTF